LTEEAKEQSLSKGDVFSTRLVTRTKESNM